MVLCLGSAIRPVAAQTVDADHFTFRAISTAMTPMLLIGGGGTIAFSAGFTGGTLCTGASADVEFFIPDIDTPPARCELYGSATYTNIICGTGFATGTATLVEYDGSSVSDAYDFTFDITYVLGFGTLTGTATERGSSEVAPITGNMAFAIGTPGNLQPVCATAITITGHLASTV